jgi:hypothetical protein
MELELIHHPQYGTLRTYELFEDEPRPQPFLVRSGSRGPLDRSQSVVQLSLPFL